MGSISPPSLSSLLNSAQERYTFSNPLSHQAYLASCSHLPGGNTRTVLHTSPFPLTFTSAQSCHLTTLDGHHLTDFLSEYTAAIYGHSHSAIKTAITTALDRGWNYGGHSGLEARLAQIICDRFGDGGIELVRFVNSGTEANMMALATAVAFVNDRQQAQEREGGTRKRRSKVLIFEKGYHGSTISGRSDRSKPSVNLPHDWVVGTYNDVEGTEELVKGLSEGSLAAILVEPMLGSGGCFEGTKEFLGMLRRLADETGALLIFDEVMTSRLGYHGLGPSLGVKPDLMTLGKWVGGGMSFGAFGGRQDIMEMYDPRKGKLEHPGTFNNNVFSMSAGIAGCELLSEEKLDELNKFGDEMRRAVEAMLKKHGLTGKRMTRPLTDAEHENQQIVEQYPKMFIQGKGSMMTIHFVGPERSLLQGVFFHHMLDHGIYIAQRGFIALNIKLRQEHVAKFVAAVDSFCTAHSQHLQWK